MKLPSNSTNKQQQHQMNGEEQTRKCETTLDRIRRKRRKKII